MRTIFDNAMVAHVWANQNQQSGRSGNGNFYFEGRTLYSYGSHYVVGLCLRPGGPYFLNADNYSPSTGRHLSYAWRAVPDAAETYRLPGLSDLSRALLRMTGDRLRPDDVAGAVAYLTANWRKLPADNAGAAWLLKAAGKRGTWAAMRGRLSAKADRVAAISKARNKAHAARRGRELAATPWRYVRADAVRSQGRRGNGLREAVADCREARLATPKAHKRVRSILWRYERGLRAALATADAYGDRWGNLGPRAKARVTLATLRNFKAGRVGYVPGYDGPDGPDKREAALALPTGAGWRLLATALAELRDSPAHMPPRYRASLNVMGATAHANATQLEGADKVRRDIAEARTRVRTVLQDFNRERRAYRDERAAGRAYAALQAGTRALSRVPDAAPWGTSAGFQHIPALVERQARVAEAAARWADHARPVVEALQAEAIAEREAERAAARAEAARIDAMSPDERAAAWRAGELSAGALAYGPVLLRAEGAEVTDCRVIAGELVTSLGARVPLSHAVRVFGFVRQCREAGQAWEAGKARPAAIRVGHFTVDRIDSTGDFKAGCHAIGWAEVERLARALGLWDCSPADLANGEAA